MMYTPDHRNTTHHRVKHPSQQMDLATGVRIFQSLWRMDRNQEWDMACLSNNPSFRWVKVLT